MCAAVPACRRVERERRAVAAEAAERGRHADGAAGVGADGGECGALLHTGSGTAGGAAGELSGVAGLKAVGEVAALAGDAVGELMEVRLAGDDRASGAKLGGDKGVGSGEAVVIAVEGGTAGGGEACEVEAVLKRDGDAPERLGVEVFATQPGGLLTRPCGVQREVNVVAGVAVGTADGVVKFGAGVGGGVAITLAQRGDGGDAGRHAAIVIGSSRNALDVTYSESSRNVLTSYMALKTTQPLRGATLDAERMRDLAAWTARTLETPNPVPFGAEIVHTKTGERLMRAHNAVDKEKDPSAHAEVRTVRLACKKLKSYSLKGYTMYTTCEPCPMCMANALWAELDRVVYGATIADANEHCRQIQIPATEVAERSDMRCKVTGPVEQALCVGLFTHPNMQRAFRTWSSRKRK